MLLRFTRSQVQFLVKNLESTSNEVVYQTLVEVRTKISKSEDVIKLIEQGGVQCLTKLLKKRNDKIVDNTLNVLVKCCLEQQGRVEFRRWNGAHSLVRVLRNTTVDSIFKQGCCLIEILCKDPESINIFNTKIIIDLLELVLIREHYSEDMKNLAVRIMMALADTQAHKEMICNLGRLCSMYFSLEECNDDHVRRAALRSMVRVAIYCIRDINSQFTGLRNGVDCLLPSLTNPLVQRQALVCIIQLAKEPAAQCILKGTGTAEFLISELGSPNSSLGDDEILTVLSAFCREDCTRDAVRLAGGLPILAKYLGDASKESLHCAILDGLTYFPKCDDGWKILLKENLIAILVQHMKLYIKKYSEDIHECNDIMVTQYSLPVTPKATEYADMFDYSSSDEDEEEEEGSDDYVDFEAVDEDEKYITHNLVDFYNLTLQFVPRTWTSYCLSMGSVLRMVQHPHSEHDRSKASKKAVCPPNLVDSKCKSRVGTSELKIMPDICIGNVNDGIKMHFLLFLLAKISETDYIEELVDSNTVQLLLDYMTLVHHACRYSSQQFVSRISIGIPYFISLLQYRFALRVFLRLCIRIHDGQCFTCSLFKDEGDCMLLELRSCAETKPVFDALVDCLLNEQTKNRTAIALSIPFIVRKKKQLKKILIESNGLEIILDALETEDLEEFAYAVLGLSHLAFTLNIKIPVEATPVEPTSYMHHCRWRRSRKDVKIVLDDCSSISASRKVLSETCPVFQAMFHGFFRESNESVIRVREISFSCMQYMIHFLYGCDCSVIHSVCLKTALEVIKESNKFLLDQLAKKMCEDIVKFHLQPYTVSKICAWCISAPQAETPSFQILCSGIAKYLLLFKMDPWDRVNLFKILVELGYGNLLADWINRIISEQLSANGTGCS